eukprot:16355490-Heterocapsa_arctica.AAC.1
MSIYIGITLVVITPCHNLREQLYFYVEDGVATAGPMNGLSDTSTFDFSGRDVDPRTEVCWRGGLRGNETSTSLQMSLCYVIVFGSMFAPSRTPTRNVWSA